MNIEDVKYFIVESNEDSYILDFRRLLLKFSLDKKFSQEFEQFISKMMEIERTFIEIGDKPFVYLKKDFYHCDVVIEKFEGSKWNINLKPFGFMGFWEIFKFKRNE